MHNNHYWLLFLAAIAISVLGYTGHTLYLLVHYLQLSEKAHVEKMQWHIEEQSSRFVVVGEYSFDVNGEMLQTRAPLLRELFWNRSAAAKAIEKYQKEPWHIWYNPRNPLDSALQKNFPTKECISTLILWAVLFYFVGIGFYVRRQAQISSSGWSKSRSNLSS